MVKILSRGQEADLERKINSDEWNVKELGSLNANVDLFVLPLLPEVLVYAAVHIKGAYLGVNYFREGGKTTVSDDIEFGLSGTYYKISPVVDN
jgi:hypothetical protein